MSFITETDYTVLIRNEIKQILVEDYSPTKINAAQQMAISQVKNYLAGKYDTEAIFNARGENRNDHIVMITIDCTLYHLYTSRVASGVPQHRSNRYQDAIDWLKSEKSSLNVSADLPVKTNPKGEQLKGLRVSSKYKAQNHRW